MYDGRSDISHIILYQRSNYVSLSVKMIIDSTFGRMLEYFNPIKYQSYDLN